jgi:hypothetical protein
MAVVAVASEMYIFWLLPAIMSMTFTNMTCSQVDEVISSSDDE